MACGFNERERTSGVALLLPHRHPQHRFLVRDLAQDSLAATSPCLVVIEALRNNPARHAERAV